MCRNYSVKARAILHAHLGRLPLNPNTLEKDRQFVIKKCPYLVQEMVSVVNQLIMLAYARRSELFSMELNWNHRVLMNYVLFSSFKTSYN